jgi:hypothetical protein
MIDPEFLALRQASLGSLEVWSEEAKKFELRQNKGPVLPDWHHLEDDKGVILLAQIRFLAVPVIDCLCNGHAVRAPVRRNLRNWRWSFLSKRDLLLRLAACIEDHFGDA